MPSKPSLLLALTFLTTHLHPGMSGDVGLVNYFTAFVLNLIQGVLLELGPAVSCYLCIHTPCGTLGKLWPKGSGSVSPRCGSQHLLQQLEEKGAGTLQVPPKQDLPVPHTKPRTGLNVYYVYVCVCVCMELNFSPLHFFIEI